MKYNRQKMKLHVKYDVICNYKKNSAFTAVILVFKKEGN